MDHEDNITEAEWDDIYDAGWDEDVCEVCGEVGTATMPLLDIATNPPCDGYQLEIVRGHRACVGRSVANRFR